MIGFAVDGFPIYGSCFLDEGIGLGPQGCLRLYPQVGNFPGGANKPGGAYDDTYNADYELSDVGDLDDCNGMTVDG